MNVHSMAAGADKEIVKNGWIVGRTLGEGGFGLVKLVTRKTDKITAACKIMARPQSPEDVKSVELEYKIMKESDHEYIVKCYEVVNDARHVFLFLELMQGGELFDKIVEKGKFTERDAADITCKLLGALDYLHGRGIIHRDLKPENMLLAREDDLSAVKLTDFGLSAMIDRQSQLLQEPCGTPGYVAPEVLTVNKYGGYDHQVDVWSMGTILYIMLSGAPPFYADDDAKLFALIKAGDYTFPAPTWTRISSGAKAFLRRMLVVDPKKRATIPQLLTDPWLSPVSASSAPDLKAGGAYAINETKEKLAKQTKAFASNAVVLTAKIRIKRQVKRARARKLAEAAPATGSAGEAAAVKLAKAPSGLSGPGIRAKPPSAATGTTGGFKPQKSTPSLVMLSAKSSAKLLRTPSAVLESVRPPAATGEALHRAISTGGFRPRPELLAAAQAAAAEKTNVERISKRVLEVEQPAKLATTLSKRASGLSGPGLLTKTPSTVSGGFKPKKVDANAVATSTHAPLPQAKSKRLEMDEDPAATYLRDVQWFAKSYGKLGEAGDETRHKQAQQVRAMVKGKSTKLVQEILEDDEPVVPSRTKAASATYPTNGNGVGLDLAEIMHKDAVQQALLKKTIAAAEERHVSVMAKMAEIEDAIHALRTEIRGPANAAEDENNPLAGMMRGLSQIFTPKEAAAAAK